MESMFKKARDMLIGSDGNDGNDEDDEKSESSVDGNVDDAEGTEEPPEEEDKDDNGEDGENINDDAAETDNKQKSGNRSKRRSKTKSKRASRSTAAVEEQTERIKTLQKEWQDTAKEILDTIKSARKADEGNASGTGTPTRGGRSTETEPASYDTHVCPKCEKKDSLGQFECALWTAGVYRKDDPKQFIDREKIYKDFEERQIPMERRFLNLIAEKFSKGNIGGSWLPGLGVGLTHDDWMNVGDNKLRTGGGEPARQLALAQERAYKGGPKILDGSKPYDLPPFTIEYLNDDRGFTWVARRFIPRGEELYREAAFTYLETRDENGMPTTDWEKTIEDVLDLMIESDKRHFMILPPHPLDTDGVTGAKLGKLTRIFRRWSVGCEGDGPDYGSRIYGPCVAFLNHSCIPNAQQCMAIGSVQPTERQKLDILEQLTAAEQWKKERRKEKKRKAKDKEKEGEEGEQDEDDVDDSEDEDQTRERILNQVESCTRVPHLTIYVSAAKDIQPGTEITVQYINMLKDRAGRHELLNLNFGFQCTCDVCTSDNDRQQAYDMVMTVLARAREGRRFKNVRKSPVKYVHECSGTLWSLLSLGIWDIRYPRTLEETGDMFAMISDNGRAFFFYMIAERIYKSLLPSFSNDMLRVRMKTDLLFQRHGKSKRGLSVVEDCLLLYLNEEYTMELLLLLGVKDKKYRRLPTYRKQHKWLKWYDRKKYIHERTQMELDKVVEWTAEWMEERLQSLYKHGNLKHCKQVERKRRGGLDKEAVMKEVEVIP
ncbi:hypothetical protein KEM56_006534, partial [Ascosphaera pollenicola]